MFIRANNFEYDKLLEGIIELGDFKDVVVDDETILKVMLNFQEAYKAEIKKDMLKPWQRDVCAQFLSCIGGSVNYRSEEEELGLKEKVDAFDALVKETLEVLEEMLEGTDDGRYWNLLEYFVDFVNEHALVGTSEPPVWHYVFDGDSVKATDFVNHLTEWLSIYSGSQLTGVNHFIYTVMNLNILPNELVRDITVLDLPGNKVKYGNALITFPIILLEVFDL